MDTKHAFSIVGPTAVGKTAMALWLAERFLENSLIAGVDLIAADSRQVYRELPVLSGADVPQGWSEQELSLPYRFFAHPDLPIALHGVQIISCREEWSVAHFLQLARTVMHHSWQEGRVPIVIGGTGLYLHQLDAPAASLGVAPDHELRASLETLSVPALQARLAQLSPTKLEQFNNSDRNNPRRLIRAIEVLSAPHSPDTTRSLETTRSSNAPHASSPPLATTTLPERPEFSHTIIGLYDAVQTLAERISERVHDRFHSGAQQEVARLLADPVGLTKPALSTLGLKEVASFLEGEVAEADVLERWSRRELQYAKRQLTWLKKYGNATWFSVATPDFREATLANCMLTI
jgi:tRNA dimethylallyltransferase